LKNKKIVAMSQTQGPIISVMLAVADTPSAVAWYKRALGATELWSLGSVGGLEIAGAPFFLGELANMGKPHQAWDHVHTRRNILRQP
jgi:hypothetical protein